MALFVVNTVTLIALGVLFLRCLWILFTNTTTIESWEISRHATLVRRARTLGGFLYDPSGQRIYIRPQEFPYDIGLWRNVAGGMGTANPLLWLFPLSPTPPLEDGLSYEENGFENKGTIWPPPDPDRMPRAPRMTDPTRAFVHGSSDSSPAEQLDAFKARQEEDLRRRGLLAGTEDQGVLRRRTFARRYERFLQDGSESDEDAHYRDREELGDDRSEGTDGEGEEAWRNGEGERLHDFGVDEVAEFYDSGKVTYENDAEDDDDVPLSKLMGMRKAQRQGS
jgi:palmitoyltransferase